MWRLAWVLGCVGVLGLGCSRGSGGSENEHEDPHGVDMQDGGGEVVSPGDAASPDMSRPMLPRCEMTYEIDQRMDGTVDYHAVRRWRSDAQLEEIRYMNRDLVIQRTRYDYDVDGRMVGYVSEDGAGDVDDSQSYTYDAQGRLESVMHDLNGDGVIDGIERYRYDAQGHIVRFSTDNGGTGVENVVWTYTYDANGLMEITEDSDGDGVPEQIHTRIEGGCQEGASPCAGFGMTLEVDTIVDASTIRTSYEDNRPVLQVTDLHSDGTDDASQRWSYDAWGGLTAIHEDFDHDGEVDQTWRVTHRLEGQPTQFEIHIGLPDGDRTLIGYQQFRYDDAGNVIQTSAYDTTRETERVYISYNADNTPSRSWNTIADNRYDDSWEYDDQGRVLRYVRDWANYTRADDGPEWVSTALDWAPDKRGILWSVDRDNDGQEDYISRSTLDDQGNTVLQEVVGMGDANAEQLQTVTYLTDYLTDWTSYTVDRYNDGGVDYQTSRVFDEQGQITHQEATWRSGYSTMDDWTYDAYGRFLSGLQTVTYSDGESVYTSTRITEAGCVPIK